MDVGPCSVWAEVGGNTVDLHASALSEPGNAANLTAWLLALLLGQRLTREAVQSHAHFTQRRYAPLF